MFRGETKEALHTEHLLQLNGFKSALPACELAFLWARHRFVLPHQFCACIGVRTAIRVILLVGIVIDRIECFPSETNRARRLFVRLTASQLARPVGCSLHSLTHSLTRDPCVSEQDQLRPCSPSITGVSHPTYVRLLTGESLHESRTCDRRSDV